MECPYCGNELIWNDYFGKIKHSEHYWLYPQSWIEKRGDIYKCENEDCDSGVFNSFFYTYGNNDELKEGYPC
jgi:hypothetical protein